MGSVIGATLHKAGFDATLLDKNLPTVPLSAIPVYVSIGMIALSI